MTEETTGTTADDQFESESHHHGHCGPWGMHPKMWMYAKMRGRRGPWTGSRSSRGPWRSRSSRAQRWLYENPTDDQIVEFLEEYQRDLEQQIEDVRSRIDDIKSPNGGSEQS